MKATGWFTGRVVVLAAVVGLAGATARPAAAQFNAFPNYVSPYSIEYKSSLPVLIGDLLATARGNYQDEASIPYSQWYTRQTMHRWGTRGPTANLYPPPMGLAQLTTEQKRERVVATAALFLNYGYQHHHVPDWNPPASFPWDHTAMPSNGPGVDCSNLASFVYNVGFGVQFLTNVQQQSAQQNIPINGTGMLYPVQSIPLPTDYHERVKTLRTGDLLYVRNHEGVIGHVAIWVGSIGRTPDHVPLVLDSHDQDVVDATGAVIPHGVRLRPFTLHSWYNKDADHVLRVIQD